MKQLCFLTANGLFYTKLTNPHKNIISKQIKITGLVQGVGFRPFIYRLAHQHQIKGWVENRNDGVLIEVESD